MVFEQSPSSDAATAETIAEPQQLGHNHTRADILVVGAGASGAVVARHLAEHGFGVVVLEQGGWASQGDFPGTRPEYELMMAQRWSGDPNTRGNPADYPVDQSGSDGPPVYMNGERIASPLDIRAIGKSKELLGAMGMPGGVLAEIRQTDPRMIQLETSKMLKLPAYTGPKSKKIAQPTKEPK